MEFDAAFAPPELRPRKKREAKIDSRGVQSVDRVVEIDAEFVPGVEFFCGTNQDLGEVGKDSRIAFFVGVRNCALGDIAAKPDMVQFVLHRLEADFDVAKAFAAGKLSERHSEELIVA